MRKIKKFYTFAIMIKKLQKKSKTKIVVFVPG